MSESCVVSINKHNEVVAAIVGDKEYIDDIKEMVKRERNLGRKIKFVRFDEFEVTIGEPLKGITGG